MSTTPDQPPPRSPIHASITIDATFGTEIQRDVSLKVLKQFLEAWAENVKGAHQKNQVTFKVNQEARQPFGS